MRAPELEPRLGFAYDVTGNGKTVLRASAGLFHNSRLGGGSLGNLRNPPFITNPILYYGTMSSMFAPGAQLTDRPVNATGLEIRHEDAELVQRVGRRRPRHRLGHGGRRLVCRQRRDGTSRWNGTSTRCRTARASSTSIRRTSIRARARRCRAEFLRPYRGYQDIFIRGNFGTSNYNALQLQVNRRYIRGVQFGASYTWGRTLGIGDDDPARVSLARPMREWNYADAAFNQDHNLVINYTWDIPGGSKFWSNAFTRGLLDGWQLSGVNAFVSGEWAGVTLTTDRGLRLHGR